MKTREIVKFWLSGLLIMAVSTASALEITLVKHSPNVVDLDRKERLKVRFTISEPAEVYLNIYDDREILVNAIKRSYDQKGHYQIEWSGNVPGGDYVPEEAYHYTVTAVSSDGETVEYDLTDYSGNEYVRAKQVMYDRIKGVIQYTLDKASRVLIRVGLKNNGPLLTSIGNWMPQPPGLHEVRWNGMDMSGIINLADNPNLSVDVYAYSLPDNAFIVNGSHKENRYISDLDRDNKRLEKKPRRQRVIAHYQQEPETRGDYEATIRLLKISKNTKDGIPLVEGKVPVSVSVEDEYKSIAIDRRIEPVFYLDGVLVFENEVGVLPTTWILDATNINKGEHYITVNIRGYEGNFGIATQKIYVE